MGKIDKSLSMPAAAAIREQAEALIVEGSNLEKFIKFESSRLGLGIGQVAAAAAHVRYAATRALKAEGLVEVLARDDFIRLAVTHRANPVKVRIDLSGFLINAECPTNPALQERVLQAFEFYDDCLKAKPGGAPWIEVKKYDSRAELSNLTTPRPDAFDGDSKFLTELRERGASLGATAGYDFPAKQTWRSLYIARCLEFRDPIVFPETKIIGLFGPLMKDARQLIAAGFKPKNIYTVERDTSVRELYYQTAASLGVTPLWGDLETILSSSKEVFDIAVCDFTGPLSPSAIRSLASLPLASDHLVVVNVMGKKEHKDVQVDLAAVSNVNAKLDTLHKLAGRRAEPWAVDYAMDEEAHNADNRALSERRGDELIQVVAGTTGRFRLYGLNAEAAALAVSRRLCAEQWSSDLPKDDDGLINEQSRNLLLTFSMQTRSTFNEFVYRNVWKDVPVPKICPLHFAAQEGLGLPSKYRIERFKYHSRESSSHSPYHSIFLERRILFEKFEPTRALVAKLAPLIERIISDIDDARINQREVVTTFTWKIANMSFLIKPSGVPVRERDLIVGVYNGRLIASFPAADIAELNRLAEFQHKNMTTFRHIPERYINADGNVA